jgi:hypothetical protein
MKVILSVVMTPCSRPSLVGRLQGKDWLGLGTGEALETLSEFNPIFDTFQITVWGEGAKGWGWMKSGSLLGIDAEALMALMPLLIAVSEGDHASRWGISPSRGKRLVSH